MTEEQQMITCCKCHGQGSYLVPSYKDFDINRDEWEKRECELCKGTGKISLQFYEDLQKGAQEMIKHREALEALKTIANYCAGRDCHTECIFCRGEVESESCCYLVYDNHSPVHYVYDTDDLEPIEKRCKELEGNKWEE